jgi:hypothetical protein
LEHGIYNETLPDRYVCGSFIDEMGYLKDVHGIT